MAYESVRLNIPLLNGGNFVHWKTKIRALLIRDDLWETVESPKPENPSNEWKKKNNKAIAVLTLSVEDNQLINFAHLDDAHSIWKTLSKKYERSTYGSRLYLRRKLYSIHYNSGPMSSHIDSIMEVVGLLRGSGKPLEDEEVVAILLISLPESYSGLVTSLEGRNEEDLTVEYVTGKILDEYQRRVEANKSECEMALQSAATGHKKVSQNYQSGLNTEKGNKNIKENRSCYFCKKQGHLKSNCRLYKKQQKSNGNESAKSSVEAKARNTEDYHCFKIIKDKLPVNTTQWCIDSGATSHMSNNKSFFSSIRDTNESVYLADGSRVIASGIGEGQLICEVPGENQIIKLKNVLYIPELDDNLISVKKVTENNYRVIFEEDTCKILDKNKVIAIAKNDGSLYRLMNAKSTISAQTATEAACIHKWHRRLGHRDPSAIKRLVSGELATGINIKNCNKNIVCEHCIKGKLSQSKFSESKTRSTGPIRLIHSDLCGPMQTPTPSGNRYFLTLIDDYSRFTVVRLIKSKDEVPKVVQEYIASMNTRFGRKPIAIRTDNGKEYVTQELKNFLKREGIQHQLTVPYTPEQNGVAERKNRSLTESAKCMLLDANLDNRFWGEAVLTATYLQNRMTSRSIDKTPVELFLGSKPDLKHLRVFGSKVFSLIPKQKRKKWDDKAEEGVLVGYDGDTKGYRILNPKTARIWISRSVRIIEDENFIEENKAKEGDSNILILSDAEKSIDIQSEEVPIEENLEEENNVENIENPIQEPPVRRNPLRLKRNVPPRRLSYKVQRQDIYINEPKTWEDILDLPKRERELWIEAACEEIKSFNQHQVWELADLPPGKNLLSSKWVFKAKLNSEGQVDTYKARLVARGFSQKYGEDYDETFAPVVKHETIRVLLALAAQRKLHVRHLDVKSAYLNGELNEELYMEQPRGFELPGYENKVLKLKKSIYGLKQSAHVWNKKASDAFYHLGFLQGNADHCLYSRKEKEGKITYILLYVDDILVVGESPEVTRNVSSQLEKFFEIKDLGDVSHYLGLQIELDKDGSILLSQKSKIEKLLEEYGLLEPKPASTPMETCFQNSSTNNSVQLPNNTLYRKAIGSLLYLATVSRPDIALSVGLLSRRVEKPTQHDWEGVKRVMRYLASTSDQKLRLVSSGIAELSCCVDADWAGDKQDRKSTSGHIFLLGNSIVAWSSKKQTSVAMSSTEAEYIAASLASKELLWLRQLLIDMKVPVTKTINMYEDNQACIRLIESEQQGARTKHIDVSFHHIRDLREKGLIDIKYCPSGQMLADVFTKPLPRETFEKMISSLGLQ